MISACLDVLCIQFELEITDFLRLFKENCFEFERYQRFDDLIFIQYKS